MAPRPIDGVIKRVEVGKKNASLAAEKIASMLFVFDGDEYSAYRHHHDPHTRCETNPPTNDTARKAMRLSVGLGNTLELVLLLDGVRVGGTLGGVDELLSKALGNGLDVAESGLTGTDGQEGDGLVDTAEGRDIDGLATDGTGGTDTGAVFAGTAVDDGVDGDLDGVLVGHDVDLRVRLAAVALSRVHV